LGTTKRGRLIRSRMSAMTIITYYSPVNLVHVSDAEGLCTRRAFSLPTINATLHTVLAEHMEALGNDGVLQHHWIEVLS
jgi:hypothetical protein